jgi:hypothetical protein
MAVSPHVFLQFMRGSRRSSLRGSRRAQTTKNPSLAATGDGFFWNSLISSDVQ